MKCYAGIGSRKTPIEILKVMSDVATCLNQQGWVLRSGHAPGADQAFEKGAKDRAEIFLPWHNFEDSVTLQANKAYVTPTKQALQLAQEYHPAWHNLSRAARLLMARNCHQVLGLGLDNPTKFVLCWTSDSSLDGSETSSGGTGQALRIANAYDIPVFNLGIKDHLDRVEKLTFNNAP